MFILKSTHYIVRTTKYALYYFTLIKAYACMIKPQPGDFRIIIANIVAITVVTVIQEILFDTIRAKEMEEFFRKIDEKELQEQTNK